jgi:hypothetical protein
MSDIQAETLSLKGPKEGSEVLVVFKGGADGILNLALRLHEHMGCAL